MIFLSEDMSLYFVAILACFANRKNLFPRPWWQDGAIFLKKWTDLVLTGEESDLLFIIYNLFNQSITEAY